MAPLAPIIGTFDCELKAACRATAASPQMR